MIGTIPSTEDSSLVLRAKIITMVCLFVISMIFGCLPLLISLKFNWVAKSDGFRSSKVVKGLLSFGGGVLFATTFMHLLPELDENIHFLEELGQIQELPLYLAALLMCCGFFMMYLIEELVHLYINSRKNKVEGKFTRVLSIRKASTGPDTSEGPELNVKQTEVNLNHSHFAVDTSEDTVGVALRGLLIVLALSIHELFEGLAVGLESSSANVWYMFGAVSAHKYIIAFCVGVELLAGDTRRWLSVLYIFTFSFVSALGIGIGILLVGGAGATQAGIWSVLLQGIACGTLLYVVFFEIWRQDRTGLFELLWGFIGFVIMVGLDVIVEIYVI